jgi:hypothetical protein
LAEREYLHWWSEPDSRSNDSTPWSGLDTEEPRVIIRDSDDVDGGEVIYVEYICTDPNEHAIRAGHRCILRPGDDRVELTVRVLGAIGVIELPIDTLYEVGDYYPSGADAVATPTVGP